MSAVAHAVRVGARPAVGREQCQRRGSRLSLEPGRRTLEEAISGAWSELVAEGTAECPVCRGTMRAASGCETCGAELF